MTKRNFQPVVTEYQMLFRCPVCRANVGLGNDAEWSGGCPECGRKFVVYMSIQMDMGSAREREQVASAGS